MISSKSTRRTPEEIAAAIITVARSEARKTRILYGSSLNLRQANRYITLLLEKGLLIHDSDRNFYRSTEKGTHFLKLFEEITELRKNLREQVISLYNFLSLDHDKHKMITVHKFPDEMKIVLEP